MVWTDWVIAVLVLLAAVFILAVLNDFVAGESGHSYD